MSQENNNIDHQYLVDYAQELVSRREGVGVEQLRVVRVLEDQVPSDKRRILLIALQDVNRPNESYSIVLDENRNEVEDLENLSESEGTSFFLSHIRINRDLLQALTVTEQRTFEIDPPENDLTLDFGAVHEEPLTVDIGAGGIQPRLDLYFLADTTGSMDTILADVKATIGLIIDEVEDTGFDVAYGVGNYRDFFSRRGDPPDDPANVFRHQLSLTTDVDQVRTAVSTWNASGGGDWPEAQLFALDQLAEPPLGQIGWRTDSKRMIVWFGDEPGHEPICTNISGLPYEIDQVSVLDRLMEEEIAIIAVDTDTGRQGLDGDPQVEAWDYPNNNCASAGMIGQASHLTRYTRGASGPPFVIVGVDPTQIVNRIIELIDNILPTIDVVTLDPSGDAEQFITAIIPSRYGPFTGEEGRPLDFDVTFVGSVHCRDDKDQTFTGQIAVKVGNDVQAVKTLVVVVPKCKPTIIGEPSAVAYDSKIRYGEQLHVYARAKNNYLYECFWDPKESEWTWVERSLPEANLLIETIFAIEEIRDHGTNIIHVFVLLRAGANLVFQDFSGDPDTDRWSWQNIPLNQQLASANANLGAVAVREARVPGQRDKPSTLAPDLDTGLALMIGSDHKLYSHRFGFGARTGYLRNHSHPGVHLKDLRARGRKKYGYGPDAFVIGIDNNLYVLTAIQRWDPLMWSWHNLGKINPDTQIEKGPAVAAQRYLGYWTFVIDRENHLLVNRWDGKLQSGGSWEDIGQHLQEIHKIIKLKLLCILQIMRADIWSKYTFSW